MPLEPLQARLLRIAWPIVGLGVLIAMVAAVTGGIKRDAPVLPIRNAGGLTMLAGLTLVLVAHRIPWLRRIMGIESSLGSRRDLGSLIGVLFVLMPMSLFALVVVAVTLTVLPPVWCGLTILALSIMVPVLLAMTVVYGRSYARTFSLAALIPTGGWLFALILACQVLFIRTDWQSNGSSVFFAVGRNGGIVVLLWLSALVIGVAAVLLRVTIEALRPRPRRSTPSHPARTATPDDSPPSRPAP